MKPSTDVPGSPVFVGPARRFFVETSAVLYLLASGGRESPDAFSAER